MALAGCASWLGACKAEDHCANAAVPPLGPGFTLLASDVKLSDLVDPSHPSDPLEANAFAADLDGDGTTSIVYSSSAAVPPVVLRVDAASDRLVPETASSDLLAFKAILGIVDLDDDGLPDLIGRGTDSLMVSYAEGAGSYTAPVALHQAAGDTPFTSDVELFDVDQDGWLDLLTAEDQFDDRCQGDKPTVGVYLRTGTRTFQDQREILGESVFLGDGSLIAARDYGKTLIGATTEACSLPLHRYFESGPRDPTTGLPTFQPVHPFGQADYDSTLLGGPMGSALGDLDGDGILDLMITGHPKLGVWRGGKSLAFEDVSERTHAMLVDSDGSEPQLPWDVAPLDFDQDGRLDLVVTHGDDAGTYASKEIGPQWVTAHWNAGDLCFTEVTSSLGDLATQGNWHSLTLADLDEDGDADLLVGGYYHVPEVFRNRIDSGNHGLSIVLHGTVSNSLGIGATIDVTATPDAPVQHFYVGGLYSVRVAQAPITFVGLGKAGSADSVVVHWPSGIVQEVDGLPAGHLHRIEEPEVLRLEPAGRHLPADGTSKALVHVTPRDRSGAPTTAASVTVKVLSGDAKVASEATQAGSEWVAEIAAPTTPGSSVIEVSIDGVPLAVRPRLWWDSP